MGSNFHSFFLVILSFFAINFGKAQKTILAREGILDLPCNDYISCVKSGDYLTILYEKEPFLVQESDTTIRDGLSSISSFYMRALTYNSESSYCFDKVQQIENQMRAETTIEIEAQYQKIIRVADGHFTNKKFDLALELYKRAVSFKPSDAYPKEKILEIERIMQSSLLKTEE